MGEKKQSKSTYKKSPQNVTTVPTNSDQLTFTTEFHVGLSQIDGYTEKLQCEKNDTRLSFDEADKTKKAAMAVIDGIVKKDAEGNIASPIDCAITETILEKRDMITDQISTLIEKGKPTPFDYYDVYYKVLEDSGLLNVSMLKPSVFRGIDGGYLAAADACSACSFCAVCSACSVCTISGVVGTGAVGGVSGTVGIFF